MIEVVSAQRCIACDKCIDVCPTSVFDRGPDGVPVIARHDDCQTCFQCEANCPADALFVSPLTVRRPLAEEELGELLGSYRAHIGWGRGRTPGSKLAVGPRLDPNALPLIS
ncbi:4Fe-4S ferredoxin [Mycolicibacterium phlei]|uniref:4Fe-4S ferredoxin n=1 Tax=Mycolicibacterium phlei DSM 43239 = CCUG 21000 TaxID=1226750 RepID=A0A5N5V2M7_MYCPH|nr:ferredoxin family protein [Mycolicibacterium phlei]VEG10847.1 4Fe-4S ferredoxin [Mycobacteroides chelonae]AMO62746.1 Electron transport complex subunit RsxB [Mycolicibacterium phlei]EID14444.1 ferredoxin [Mycolicibacterium phlei RIVM601174]KAB7755928.1 4Fe-4S ferredoxin [Mycolicibacterium phlei DSM 43239 = CCUG 21000]KXW65885.1 4Fe-4S ferredoxin [Mycolicibacterium phlei DSM 43239 = CCUG 21000]